MAYDAELSMLQAGIAQLLDLEQAALAALDDRKVTPVEWMMLGMKGSALATYCLTLAQGLDVDTRKRLAWVAKHAVITASLPDGLAMP